MLILCRKVIKIKEKMTKLRKKIEYHNNLYYNLNTTEISDEEYDALTRELRELEQKHPEFAEENSPTKSIGGKPDNIFAPVKHAVKMESLNDVFSEEEITDFICKIKDKHGEDVEFIVEPKIDGLSVSLEYKNGVFVRGSTRGNGEIGEDVTHNLNTIADIPKKLKSKPEFLEVRGEVYMSHSKFIELNKEQTKQGLELFANPRNAAAGSLRQLDSEIAKKRNLSFIAFNIQDCKGIEFYTHFESLKFLENEGFVIPPMAECLTNESDILNSIKNISLKKDTFEFGIDGAVVKVNDFTLRKTLGSTAKAPRWASAYKYKPEQKATKLLDITLKIGRTGILTPNAVLQPVTLSGSRVSHATLHNVDMIEKKDIRIGDEVVVQKAGEIIPEVAYSIHEKRDGTERIFVMPKKCPFCGGKVVRGEGESAYRCINPNCNAQKERAIIHFAGREAMDIEGLGDALIRELIARKWVSKVSDLYTLTPIDLFTHIPGIKEKAAEKLIENIEKSKSSGLGRLLFALGVKNLGSSMAKTLAENFKDIDNVINATEEELVAIHGISGTVCNSIMDFFSDKDNVKLIKELKSFGVSTEI